MQKLYKLNLTFDINLLLEDFKSHEHELINKGSSFRFPIQGVPGREETYDSLVGHFFDKDFSERDVNTVLDIFDNTETKRCVEVINQYTGTCRARYLTMIPTQTYRMHIDSGWRLHIPIISNDNCYFFHKGEMPYYMEADGSCYIVSVDHMHTAMNLSEEKRTHIVMGIDNPEKLIENFT